MGTLAVEAAPHLSRPDLSGLLPPFSYDEQRLCDFVASLKRGDIDAFAHDPWAYNFVLNHWEHVHGKYELESYPWRVYLPVADSCNARCEFCTSWLNRNRYMTPAQVDALAPVLSRAAFIDLCGYGEPLSNPHFSEVVSRLEAHLDSRCQLALFSNGALLERWLDRLVDLGVNIFNISLNAASAETHDAVMGLGPKAFDRVVNVLRILGEKSRNPRRDAQGHLLEKPIFVSATFVPTSTNIHETAQFVDLCDELGLTSAYIRVLQQNGQLISGLNYHLLPPTLNPEFHAHREAAIEAIKRAKITVYASPENWDLPILPEALMEEVTRSPPKIYSREDTLEYARSLPEPVYIDKEPDWPGQEPNPFMRTPRFDCTYVYRNLLLNREHFFVTPCCYMRTVPKFDPVYYDGSKDFFVTWNSPAFVELRRSLVEGPLMRHCKVCPQQK